MYIRIFDLELTICGNKANNISGESVATFYSLLFILTMIVIGLYFNWLYTLLILSVFVIIVGSIMFDKSFDEIEKQIKEQNNGNDKNTQ